MMTDTSSATLMGIGVFILTVASTYVVLRLLKRPVDWRMVIGLAVCIGAPVITFSRIKDADIVKGLETGGATVTHTITNKKEDFYVGRYGKRSPRYLLCYEDRGEKCAEVNWGTYNFEQIGAPITVTFVSSSTEPQHLSNPNNDSGFDKFLLGAEIIGAFLFLLKIIFPDALNFDRLVKNENISILKR